MPSVFHLLHVITTSFVCGIGFAVSASSLVAQETEGSLGSIPTSLPTTSKIIEARVNQNSDEQKIYRESCNSVVQIEKSDPLGVTLATGFFIDGNGLIATVIATNRNPDNISVTWNERTYRAELLAIDQRTRLALLKINEKMTPALMLSRGLDAAIGGKVYAVSDTADALKRITAGRIAGREGVLQKSVLPTTILRLHISATPDAFGAPVLDGDGKVAAVLLINLDEENEVCFALPSEIVHKTWSDYKQFKRVEPAWCGFTLELGTTTPKIIFVQDGSPAAAAGFRPGDVLLKIGNRPVPTYQDVVDRCYYLTAGQAIEIGILRGQENRSLTLTPKAASELAKPRE